MYTVGRRQSGMPDHRRASDESMEVSYHTAKEVCLGENVTHIFTLSDTDKSMPESRDVSTALNHQTCSANKMYEL
jgi:hypothetical protein